MTDIALAPELDDPFEQLDDDVCIFCDDCRRFLCTGENADEGGDMLEDDDAPATCAECVEIDEFGECCPWCGVPK